eukprot:2793806-Rhodomonas_salina.1
MAHGAGTDPAARAAEGEGTVAPMSCPSAAEASACPRASHVSVTRESRGLVTWELCGRGEGGVGRARGNTQA